MKKNTLRVLAILWAVLIVAALSSTVTVMLSGRVVQQSPEGKRWVSEEEYATLLRYDRLEQVRQTLKGEFYQELDDETLVLGAIRGMTDAVEDPYTFYYTAEEYARSMENNSGQYCGIGVLLQQNTATGEIRVVRVYPDTPAETAGVKANDLLLAVDGVEISGEDGRTYNDAVNRIRGGAAGTEVVLTLLRGDEQVDLAVIRGEISINYAEYRMLEGDIGYLSIAQFTGDAADVCAEAFEYFREQGAVGMIIDVRNNPGGYLDQVVDIADGILPEGVIVYIKSRNGSREDYYSDANYYGVPLVVLVNESSASASEILAASVQTLGRGTVIGTTTFGKGIVQTLKTFSDDGSAMQLTTSVYYDANDRTPNGAGIEPDIVLAFEGDEIPLEPDPSRDNQLAEAIAYLHRQAGDEQTQPGGSAG